LLSQNTRISLLIKLACRMKLYNEIPKGKVLKMPLIIQFWNCYQHLYFPQSYVQDVPIITLQTCYYSFQAYATIIVKIILLNHLNTKLNPIWHLLALLRAHPILHVSRVRVNFTLYVFTTILISSDEILSYRKTCFVQCSAVTNTIR
jgi:hypothetical protein